MPSASPTPTGLAARWFPSNKGSPGQRLWGAACAGHLPPTDALRAKHRQPAHAFTEPFARTGKWLRKTNGPGTSLVSQPISANGVQKRGHVQSVSRLAEQLLKVHHCHTCDGLLRISFNVWLSSHMSIVNRCPPQ